MSIERIVAAVIDTQILTLYREDGTTIEIPQGDERVKPIIEQVIPIINAGRTAEVDITQLNNNYKDFEEKSSGLVKLFRVAKKTVAGIFSDTPVVADTTQPTTEAVNEIMANAVSVRDDNFKDSDTTENDTIIAVVSDDKGVFKVIPGAENLKGIMKYAGKIGSTKGVENLLKRMANVIDKRQHSVEDLLRFLERGDLPIADDGSIIAYKILRNDPENLGGFVDCHTQKVKQRVGSYVCVNEDLVDKSRRNECSNGLHIARRGYIGNFYGDLITMCKIAPEDVVTVPHGDPDKVRVCGYHILFKLDDATYRKLQANQPATDIPATAKLLSEAIAGNHAPPSEEVRITAPLGEGVVITSLVGTAAKKPSNPEMQHTALDDMANELVDPIQLSRDIRKAKQQIATNKPEPVKPMTSAQQAREMFSKKEWKKLHEFKRAKKKSWANLGFNSLEQAEVIEHG